MESRLARAHDRGKKGKKVTTNSSLVGWGSLLVGILDRRDVQKEKKGNGGGKKRKDDYVARRDVRTLLFFENDSSVT